MAENRTAARRLPD